MIKRETGAISLKCWKEHTVTAMLTLIVKTCCTLELQGWQLATILRGGRNWEGSVVVSTEWTWGKIPSPPLKESLLHMQGLPETAMDLVVHSIHPYPRRLEWTAQGSSAPSPKFQMFQCLWFLLRIAVNNFLKDIDTYWAQKSHLAWKW